MKDLLDRLEAASEGSEDLDIEISEAMHPDDVARGETVSIVRYTRSLDAALTLFPPPGMNRCWGISENPDRDRPGPCCTIMLYEPAIEAIEVFAPTLALAMCIAALRARSASDTGEG